MGNVAKKWGWEALGPPFPSSNVPGPLWVFQGSPHFFVMSHPLPRHRSSQVRPDIPEPERAAV